MLHRFERTATSQTRCPKTTRPVTKDHCDKCGAPTIRACLSCQRAIRGFYHSGVLGFGSKNKAPAFCYKCGKPFPWTDAGLRAAEELADELDGLTSDERESLKKSLHDLVRETPRTRVAETRFKKTMRKVSLWVIVSPKFSAGQS